MGPNGPSTTQRRQQSCGCRRSTHLWKPQGSVDATRARQETSLEGRPFGYCLPLPLTKATKILDILITPMNIQQQNTINEHGWIVLKDRLTHDQSLSGRPGHPSTAVSSRMSSMFGSCIRQIVNWAITTCCLVPNVPILASKIDFKSAFRKCISTRQLHYRPAPSYPNSVSFSCGCIRALVGSPARTCGAFSLRQYVIW